MPVSDTFTEKPFESRSTAIHVTFVKSKYEKNYIKERVGAIFRNAHVPGACSFAF